MTSPTDPSVPPTTRARGAFVLGVTGAPAAGKSTVCRRLGARGCRVIDVDALGHEALDDPAVRARVTALFGETLLGPDGRLDRTAVAKRVFGDEAALERLESIVHPAVRRLLGERLVAEAAAIRDSGGRPVIVLECALLFEGGLDAICDATLCVQAAREIRAARAAQSRGWTDEDLARREQRQLPAGEKSRRAHVVLDNDAPADDPNGELDAALDALLDHIATLQSSRPVAGPEGTAP